MSKNSLDKDKLYLVHILECARDIENYLSGCGDEAFLNPGKTQDAVLRKLEILGESPKRLSENIKRNLPQIPWAAVSGLRNIIAHEYFALDLPKLLVIIRGDLPVLRAHVTALCKERYNITLSV